MLSLKFPKIHNLLVKTETLQEGSIQRGVIVMNNHAMVLSYDVFVVINLQDYFTQIQKIKDMNQIKVMDEILDFLHGKMFAKEYWDMLTKGEVIEIIKEDLNEDRLMLSTLDTKKELIHENIHFDAEELFNMVVREYKREDKGVVTQAIDFESIVNLKSAFGIKNDNLITRSSGNDSMLKFTFTSNRFIFGLFAAKHEETQENFLFDDFGNFVSLIAN